MGDRTGLNRVYVSKPEGYRPVGRPGHRLEDNIKMDLHEVGYEGMDWISVREQVAGTSEYDIQGTHLYPLYFFYLEMLSIAYIILRHTHTHTHIYIYIYMYTVKRETGTLLE
jgi:hypothetical protein